MSYFFTSNGFFLFLFIVATAFVIRAIKKNRNQRFKPSPDQNVARTPWVPEPWEPASRTTFGLVADPTLPSEFGDPLGTRRTWFQNGDPVPNYREVVGDDTPTLGDMIVAETTGRLIADSIEAAVEELEELVEGPPADDEFKGKGGSFEGGGATGDLPDPDAADGDDTRKEDVITEVAEIATSDDADQDDGGDTDSDSGDTGGGGGGDDNG